MSRRAILVRDRDKDTVTTFRSTQAAAIKLKLSTAVIRDAVVADPPIIVFSLLEFRYVGDPTEWVKGTGCEEHLNITRGVVAHKKDGSGIPYRSMSWAATDTGDTYSSIRRSVLSGGRTSCKSGNRYTRNGKLSEKELYLGKLLTRAGEK